MTWWNRNVSLIWELVIGIDDDDNGDYDEGRGAACGYMVALIWYGNEDGDDYDDDDDDINDNDAIDDNDNGKTMMTMMGRTGVCGLGVGRVEA